MRSNASTKSATCLPRINLFKSCIHNLYRLLCSRLKRSWFVFEARITELLKTTEDDLHGVFHDIFVFIFFVLSYNLLSINVNNIWIEIIWEIAVSR